MAGCAARFRAGGCLRRVAAAGAATVLGGIARPYLSRAADRPHITHGIQSGDVSLDSGIVWARADRPARMIGRGRDDRQLQGHHPRRVVRRAAGERFHRKGAARACRPDRTSSIACAFEDIVDHRRSPASRRSGASARRRTRSVDGVVRVVGRHARAAGASTRRAAACAPTRPCCATGRTSSSIAATTSTPSARSARSRSSRTARSGATSSRKKNRASPRRSPTIAATTNTICSTAICAPSTPRSRCSRNGTTTRSPTTGGPACRCASATPTSRRSRRAAAARSTNTCRRGRPRPSAGASTARSLTARCSTCSCSTCAAIAGRTATAGRTAYGPAAHFLGPAQIAWLKRELAASRATWKVIAADLPIGVMSYDAVAQGDGPPLGRELEIADLLSLHQARGRAQHGVDHRRHALHRRALLRSEPRGVPGLRAVLGVRVRARSTPAPAAPACSTTRSARARSIRRRAARSRATTSRRASACSSSATWRSTARREVMTVTLKDVGDRALWSIDLAPRDGIS